MIQFVTPALLLGALLFAVPLIIHLLNRQRYRKRPWAAMEFLLAAYKKQRRRLRRENLILLLLRCLIPILLAFAIARPVLRSSSAVPGVDGATHQVFLFDHGYSMDLQPDGGTTPFERSKQLAQSILDRLSDRSGSTRVTIMTNGLRPRMVLQDDLGVQRAEAEIAALPRPVDAGAELGPALDQIADFVETIVDADVRVHVMTDLQMRAFGDALKGEAAGGQDTADGSVPAGAPSAGGVAAGGDTDGGDDEPGQDAFEDTILDAIRRIQDQENATLTVFDTRSRSRSGDGGQEDNTQIVDVRVGTAAAIAKTQTPVTVQVVHRASTARTVEVTLELDGGQPIRRSVELAAGGEAEVEFLVTFPSVGQHRLEAMLEEDNLPVDDRRGLVVPVRDRIRVVLVEGLADLDAPEERDLRLSPFLVDVLDPTGGEGGPELTTFAPRVVDGYSFLAGREVLDDADVVVLCGLERLNEDAGRILRDLLRRGCGVWIQMHPSADVGSYNLHLHSAGTGPLPLRLESPTGFRVDGDENYGGEITAPDHPVFADLVPEVYREIFESLPITRFYQTDEASLDEDAQVLMRVRDPQRSPLLVASAFEDGRVLLMTSGQSRRPDRWNRLEFEVTAFPFVHRTALWLSNPTSDPFNVEAGQPLTAVVDAEPEAPTVIPPERAGGRPEALSGDARPLLGERFALPPYRNTAYSGFYRVTLDDRDPGTRAAAPRDPLRPDDGLWFAVQPEVAEGELLYAGHQILREELGLQNIETALPATTGPQVDAGIRDLGPLLLFATLLFLLGEAAYARWISRHRS